VKTITCNCPGLTLRRSCGANGSRQGQLRPCRIHGAVPMSATPFIPCSRFRHRRRSSKGFIRVQFEVSRLLRHGDFGLGTFIDLDGEMVVLEGVCYRVTSDGVVNTVEGDRLIPYAVVTRFTAEFAKNRSNLRASLNWLRYAMHFARRRTCSTPFVLKASFPS
jgi:hypothetical protein